MTVDTPSKIRLVEGPPHPFAGSFTQLYASAFRPDTAAADRGRIRRRLPPRQRLLTSGAVAPFRLVP